MAVDRALLDAHEAGQAPATLRLYGWRAPTVSLGRFQRADDVDLAVCREYGVELCRRPTGGRGVLHDDEVTYSIVAGVRDGLPRGVGASYRILCEWLVAAFGELGIDAALTPRPRGERGAGACYLHATPADLSLGVAKLSGSAQVWSKDSCLQHGSFVISRDVEREARVFRLGAEGARALAGSTGTISEALGRSIAPQEVADAVIRGVSRALGVALEPTALSSAERAAAENLVDGFRVV